MFKRLAAFFNNLSAINLIFFLILDFLDSQSAEPNLSKIRELSSNPYLVTKLRFSTGRSNLSLFLYIIFMNSLVLSLKGILSIATNLPIPCF